MTTSYPVEYSAFGGLKFIAGTDVKVRADAVSGASLIAATLEMLIARN